MKTDSVLQHEKELDSFFASWPLDNLLIKITNTCTFKCSYCFWFRDEAVQKLPKSLLPEVEKAMLTKIEKQITKYNLTRFSVTLHGGEPLLYGFSKMEPLLAAFKEIELRTGAKIPINIQTNGSLINEKWAKLFKKYNLSVGVSIDGPQEIHDKNRKSYNGRPTYDLVKRGVDILRREGIDFGTLSVCDPTSDPQEILDFIVNEIGLKNFDILIPDFTHDDSWKSIKNFYIGLFDHWLENYASRGVRIRTLDNIIYGLLGRESKSEAIGFGPMTVITLDTDGSYGPTDTLRIIGDKQASSSMNILNSDLEEICSNRLIRWTVEQSLMLPSKCLKCENIFSCGGGYLPHRWSSNTNDFQNPSIYCEDLKEIFHHIRDYLESDIKVMEA